MKERIGGDYFSAASTRAPCWRYSPPNAISCWIQDTELDRADREETEKYNTQDNSNKIPSRNKETMINWRIIPLFSTLVYSEDDLIFTSHHHPTSYLDIGRMTGGSDALINSNIQRCEVPKTWFSIQQAFYFIFYIILVQKHPNFFVFLRNFAWLFLLSKPLYAGFKHFWLWWLLC